MITELKHIFQNIHEPDEALNEVIQKFIDGSFYAGDTITVQQWRIDNYSMLRDWAYPKLKEKSDADVKLLSKIPEMVEVGQLQLDAYVQDCLNVKTRFPK